MSEKYVITNYQISFITFLAFCKSFAIRGHSKITSQRKCQILDPPSPYVTFSNFFHYTRILPTRHVTMPILTNFFLVQGP